MNRKQEIAILIGAAVLVLMGLFPPWRYTVKEHFFVRIPRTLVRVHEFERYRFLFLDPSRTGRTLGRANPRVSDISVRLDSTRLVVQWAVVVLAAGPLVFALRTKPARSP